MSGKCPICESDLIPDSGQYPPLTGDSKHYDCPRCGGYSLSRSAADDLSSKLRNDSQKIAGLSHAIRKMQRNKRFPFLNSYFIDQLLQNPLPNLFDQVNNFILWLGDNSDLGHSIQVRPIIHQSVIGAKTKEGYYLVEKHLQDLGFVKLSRFASAAGADSPAKISLTVSGWKIYDELTRGARNSRKAFMAMKYGDSELDRIVSEYFRPAVVSTGFELYKLDDIPKAGLIDDRLRVEIRTSRFLISDLTHENAGAYWEAGFAEGLGKPVIYTCEKTKFESHKTHFDTNHHLTVIWDKDKPELAKEQLKATIRATLPDEAKLTEE